MGVFAVASESGGCEGVAWRCRGIESLSGKGEREGEENHSLGGGQTRDLLDLDESHSSGTGQRRPGAP
jgi:hypothetical protein